MMAHALGVTELAAFTAAFELNLRDAGFDEVSGQRYRDSGGAILYLAPSLRVKLPWPWRGGPPQLRGSVQIPATSSWLHGFQREFPIWFGGLQYTF